MRSVLALAPWYYCTATIVVYGFHLPRFIHQRRSLIQLQTAAAKNDDVDDDDRMKQKGLDEALRRLDELGADALRKESPTKPSSPIKVSSELLPEDAPESSLESEVKIYGDLMSELDENEQSENYNDMMEELGGQAKQTFDTYNSVLHDMGGTPKGFGKKQQQKDSSAEVVNIPDAVSKEMLEEKSTERFMEKALKEAIKDVKLNNPEFSKEILSDKSIMNEIEKIFEEGNEKLKASVEEIKREQRELVEQANAKRNANSSSNDALKQDQERLHAAQESMQNILKKVDTEAAQVERAVVDLNSANQELENSFVYKLKAGGLPKQMSFVGILFFSVRSMIDTVGAVSSGDAASLTSALVQGGIVLVCAILYAIL